MANVSGPLHSIDASGSLGPLTYQAGVSGHVCKLRYPGVNTRTIKTTDFRRQVISQLSYAWRSIDLPSLTEWQAFAKEYTIYTQSGKQKRISARDWFFRLNVDRIRILGVPTTRPPLSPVCDYFPTLFVEWTASGYLLYFSPIVPAGYYLIIRQLRNRTQSQIYSTYCPLWGALSSINSSPRLISPAAGVSDPDSDLPPVYYGLYTDFKINAMDYSGRQSPIWRTIVRAL